MSPESLDQVIRSRRAVFPPQYDADRPIPVDVIEEILNAAQWAPTHKRTEPWRFVVFTGDALAELGQFLADQYRRHTPADQFSEKKFEKNLRKTARSACIIAIIMQRDPGERLPEWEEIASVACSVQNMWLACTARGIGAYWSSPATVMDARAAEFLHLDEGQRCLGLFYMGYLAGELPEGKREGLAGKVSWRD